MKKKRVSNWVLLIIAFLIAVLIWMFGIQEDNPNIEISLGKIPVEILNEEVMHENNLAYWITDNEEVTVTVTVPQTSGWEVSASDIKLTADFSNWHPGFATIPIAVEVVNNKKIIGTQYRLSENVLKIQTEEMSDKEVNLDLQVQGTVASDYTVLSTSMNLEKVIVTAPAEALEKVAKAQVTVDVEGRNGQVKEKSDVVLYDEEDNVLDMDAEQILLNHSTVNVTVEIGKLKTVSLVLPDAQGKPADGYVCTGVSANMTEIQIAGQSSVIAKLTSLDLSEEKISVKGVKENVTVKVDLSSYLPDGVQLSSTQEKEIELTAAVKELTVKDFVIPVSDIEIKNLSDTQTYVFVGETVKCQIRGLEQDMKTLTLENLNPFIDLKDATQDQIAVSVEFGIDENTYEVVSTPLVTLKIQ